MAIELMSKIKPKGGGTFAMVDASDVEMADGTRLDEALHNVKGSGYVVSAEPPEDIRMLWLDPYDSGTSSSGDLSLALNEIDELIGGNES